MHCPPLRDYRCNEHNKHESFAHTVTILCCASGGKCLRKAVPPARDDF